MFKNIIVASYATSELQVWIASGLAQLEKEVVIDQL